MDNGNFFTTNYTGSKTLSQWDIVNANATGFGAAADDYMERGIDLNEQLIRNKPATYFMRVSSDAMKEAGIFRGDVVIVDRSLAAGSARSGVFASCAHAAPRVTSIGVCALLCAAAATCLRLPIASPHW
jgi:DNA polymerase V